MLEDGETRVSEPRTVPVSGGISSNKWRLSTHLALQGPVYARDRPVEEF